MRQKLIKIVQYGVLVVAWSYLIYRLVTYEDYATVWSSMKQCGWKEWCCLTGAVALIFPNILAEAWKWQTLVRNIEPVTIREAWWQVCYGQLTAFVTPYRVGDYPGRVLGMTHRDRWPRLIAQGYIGSVVLTAVIAVVGVVAYIGWGAVLIAFAVSSLSVMLYKPIVQSMVRYMIWMVQLWLILRWVGIGLDPTTALTVIATYYLLVTVTPSMPAADAAVRGSWMMVVMGQYGANEASAAMAAMGMWALNTLIPMFFGIFAPKNLHISK